MDQYQKDRDEYGSDFIDLVHRHAKDASAAETAQLKQSVAELQKTLSKERRQNLNKMLDERLGKNWRQQNDDPNFVKTLETTRSDLTGRPVLEHLREAYAAGDAARVEHIFRTFKGDANNAQANAWSGNNRQRGAAHPSGKPWIRGSDIRAFYKAVTDGRYRGREAEQREAEADLQQAMREGRVIE
jgi:hypothetical protein